MAKSFIPAGWGFHVDTAERPSPEFAQLMAGTRGGKIVRGEEIARTVVRKATEEERWRYGVELRITGSRWRPQTRAPHYPKPEPYVYRKAVHSLSWRPYQLGRMTQLEKYEAWLAERDKLQAVVEEKPVEPASAAVVPKLQAVVEEKPVEPASAAVVPLRVVASTPVPALEDDRRQAAADLLREIAGQYGPRRAHKLRAMADWLVGQSQARPQTASAT